MKIVMKIGEDSDEIQRDIQPFVFELINGIYDYNSLAIECEITSIIVRENFLFVVCNLKYMCRPAYTYI